MKSIQSALIWAANGVLILVWLPLMAVVRLFDRDPAYYVTGRLFRKLGDAMTRVNPLWRVHVEGDFPTDPRRPYVVVSNHQSHADIPVISRLPWEMKWVAKAELFRLPVVGWLLRMAGDIAVDRRDPRSRARVLIAVDGPEGVPPVELLELDGEYYVKDGHHRISVMKRLGIRSVEAYVTSLSRVSA